jgi:hypothetical protein
MAGKTAWTVQNMVAWGKGYVRNTLIYRALLVIFWALAFLVPLLLLGLAFMLKAYEAAFGKELNFASKSKASL